MTRRLVVAIVATVAATLVVAGVITLAIARSQAKRTTEDELRTQAEALVATVVAIDDESGSERPLARAVDRRVVRAVRQALRVDGAELVLVGPAGAITGTLPDGVGRDDLDVDVLRAGETASGASGSLVFAAAPAQRARTTIVAVVTREASPGLASAARWFLLAAVATLVLGAIVAFVLGRRLARPVRDASSTARRIADGELSARLPDPGDGSPGDELADLARAVNTMAASLEQSKDAERQFLLSVSHDLRTPLTSIRGYAEAIADGAAPDVRAAAGVIESQAQRLERLVGDLLDLARLDARTFTLHPVDFDLRAAVTEVVEAHRPHAARAGLSIAVSDGDAGRLEDGPRRPVVVHADPARVQQILGNLLDNGERYARSRIDIGVSIAGGEALMTVDDDGPGIAEAERPHVFARLYVATRPARPAAMGPDGTPSPAGSGLGLAIVQQLATQMGGSVAATTAPGGGARLEVRLPLAAGAPPLPPPAS
ncbi:MAG TPA: HAMP domain-containing sensor histidine kinase [Acidimicrobiales bacterium]|jgi:signal transduction histidine kinase|nr:HAMP domain-containing sensor histidine kinase [Acidimicrobiales bacterium]